MMTSNVRPSRKDLKSAMNTRFSSESKENSKQLRNSKTAKERILSHDEHKILKSKDKLKVKPCVGRPNTDVPHDLRREAEGKILVQPNSLGNQLRQCVKDKATEDDELVKYMSNLPDYLQRMEGGENLQDKAFNVGVLDWARLEKWKYTQKNNLTSGHNNIPSTSSISLRTTIKSPTFSSAAQQGTHVNRTEQTPSILPIFHPSQKDDLPRGGKPSSQKVLRFQDTETSPKRNLGGNRKIPRAGKASASNNAEVTLRKGKTRCSDQKSSEMEKSSTNLSNYVKIALSQKEKESAWEENVKKKVQEGQESNTDRNLDGTYVVSPGSNEKLSEGSDETEKRTRKLKSIPKESREILDEKLFAANHNSLSGGLPLKDVCSEELRPDIPHSCPLPPKVETKVEPILTAHSLANSPRVELSSDAFQNPYSNKTSDTLFEAKAAEQCTHKVVNVNVIENTKLLDQEMAATKSRNPSPNRRFSFSLRQIGRSFSLKDGSTVPQLSSPCTSVKSVPMKSEEFSCLDDSNRNKVNGTNRARSSPLRRILDPLLRSKGSNPVHDAETVQPKESYISLRPIRGFESLPNEAREPPTTEALLQRIIKNGLPLFRFVAANNSSVLAASTKNLAYGKDDSDQNYTFYSVNEIKKKSGSWINQGRQMKSCGYAYNVIGQMKVHNSRLIDLTQKNSQGESIVRESVLFGVELRHDDKASPPQFMQNKELAAVVMKMTREQQKDKNANEKGLTECMSRDGCSVNLAENGNTNSTTVILPGDVHGLPKKGEPSTLIERWKSGGVCDCGGWDVGCKLRILTNHNQNCKFRRPSNCSANSDSFELYLQGKTQQNKPILSLVPLNKEIYSVEFNSSFSPLQAFFVCVTVLCCPKEPMVNGNGNGISRTHQNIFSGKIPPKYAPNPPTSPVGRV